MQHSDAQKRAITHNKGAMLVLAGPGSGKTTVITKRTRELIESAGVAQENILVITFTKAAATEMKERFLKLCGTTSTAVNFGTFHAVFFKIIKYAYSYDISNILSEDERYMYLRDIVYKLELDVRDEREFISSVSSEISLIKNSGIKLENYYSKNCGAEDFRKLYKAFEARKSTEKKIDFDDMLIICYELLTKRPDILAFWQKRYTYVLIDEFQDINLLQYNIIKLLAQPENNIFAVGDDDQSIYGFRGAKPGIMLGFEKDYPKCERVVLDKNFRSGSDIIRASLKLIERNGARFSKAITAGRTDEEGMVSILSFKNVSDQNDFVAKKILELLSKGEGLSDIAVLYRLNSQPGLLVHKLGDYNIRFRLADRLPDIFEHWIAKDMFAYMELAKGDRKRINFLQIANRPKRYISRDIFVRDEMSFNELERLAADKPYVIRALDRLRYDLDTMSGLDPFAAIMYIRNAIGYDKYLEEYANYRGIDRNELFEVITELEESVKGFANLRDLYEYIEEYREKMKTAAQRTQEDSSQAVKLMTFHGAKGLEFNNVFIIDANEGFAPYTKSGIPDDIEEERRMFYVAMTRAKKRLYLLSSRERLSRKLEVSRFISEIRAE